jgi:hypothetical protein
MKCLNVFLLTQKYFPDHVNDSFKDGEGIPSVLLKVVSFSVKQPKKVFLSLVFG